MSVPVDIRHRGRPRDPRRRQAILAAAIALVAEVGYDRMTLDAIATRAGVSKPTIYRRWPGGKSEIVVEAIRAKRSAAGPLPDTGSLRGDLLAYVQRACAGLDTDVAGGVVSQLRSSAELTTLIRDEVVADERRRYDQMVARAVERGELAGPVPALFADVAGSLIFTRRLISGEPTDDAFVEELVDQVLLPILSLNKEPHGINA